MNLANHYIADRAARLALGLPVAGTHTDDTLHHHLTGLYAAAPHATLRYTTRPILTGDYRGHQAVTVTRIYPDGGVLPVATATIPPGVEPAHLDATARTAAADLTTAA